MDNFGQVRQVWAVDCAEGFGCTMESGEVIGAEFPSGDSEEQRSAYLHRAGWSLHDGRWYCPACSESFW